MTPPAPAPSDLDAAALMTRCPRFHRCNAPLCPLDLLQARRVVLPGEARCTLPKPKRRALASGFALPFGGLTEHEWKREQAWARLPEEEKARRKARLARFRFVSPRPPETSPGEGAHGPPGPDASKSPQETAPLDPTGESRR